MKGNLCRKYACHIFHLLSWSMSRRWSFTCTCRSVLVFTTFTDSPLGVRYANFVSACSILKSATSSHRYYFVVPSMWLPLSTERWCYKGAAMCEEFCGKDVSGETVYYCYIKECPCRQLHLVPLGPMMNLMRAPAAERNWPREGWEHCQVPNRDFSLIHHRFGGDPYLSGEGAFKTVTSLQS